MQVLLRHWGKKANLPRHPYSDGFIPSGPFSKYLGLRLVSRGQLPKLQRSPSTPPGGFSARAPYCARGALIRTDCTSVEGKIGLPPKPRSSPWSCRICAPISHFTFTFGPPPLLTKLLTKRHQFGRHGKPRTREAGDDVKLPVANSLDALQVSK